MIRKESSMQRIKRLVAESTCECGAPCDVSQSCHDGTGRWEHLCRDCMGWASDALARIDRKEVS